MPDSPRCRILVRTAIDWNAMTPEGFRSQTDPMAPQLFIHGAVKHDLPTLFEQTFGVNFFRYRAELQKISEQSIRSVENAEITKGFNGFESWFENDQDEFIFPIDDDDLFAPHLAQAIGAVGPETVLIVWDHIMAGFVDFKPSVSIKKLDHPVLFSNNWGVRKSFLREQFTAEEAKWFLARHRHAHEECVRIFNIPYDHMPDGPLKKFVPLAHPAIQVERTCYGADYMHPGSLHFFSMLTQNGNGSPGENLQAFNQEAALPCPEYIQWAAPYFEAYSSAIQRLREHPGSQ